MLANCFLWLAEHRLIANCLLSKKNICKSRFIFFSNSPRLDRIQMTVFIYPCCKNMLQQHADREAVIAIWQDQRSIGMELQCRQTTAVLPWVDLMEVQSVQKGELFCRFSFCFHFFSNIYYLSHHFGVTTYQYFSCIPFFLFAYVP